ncbi:MAG: LacI family DNA-binding transcriptional regulator [Verrucomicrobiota bacterium JB024]|nr:LacI family DNA-binding transcriptional regulator [Verrucomicrobiota bacterium JB024]
MANQRTIAKIAGVNQATVSLALRNDPSIPLKTRERIRQIAEEIGYRPNNYVSSLMSQIRSGRPPQDKGCIAVVVSGHKPAPDKSGGGLGPLIYQQQYQGMYQRAVELGFKTEFFFLLDSGISMKRVDGILKARGINGMVLGAPNTNEADATELSLNSLAVATIAYTWTGIDVDRVTSHHRHNVKIAYNQLLKRGFKRIGMCLSPGAAMGVDTNWRAGYLIERENTPTRYQIPLFVGRPDQTPKAKFTDWLNKWKPEAIVSILGHEKLWLDELKISVPDDLSVVCINRLPNSEFSGVQENHETIGAAAIDLVATQLIHNEFGLPKHPKLILFEGTWVEGKTIGKPPRRRK